MYSHGVDAIVGMLAPRDVTRVEKPSLEAMWPIHPLLECAARFVERGSIVG